MKCHYMISTKYKTISHNNKKNTNNKLTKDHRAGLWEGSGKHLELFALFDHGNFSAHRA